MAKNKFLSPLLLFSVFLLAVVYAVNSFLLPQNLKSSVIYWFVVYFFVTAFFVQKQFQKANQKSPQHFVTVFMGTSAIRILAAIIILVIFGFFYSSNFKGFAVQFVSLYVIFLVYEVVGLQSLLKGKKTEQKSPLN